MGRRCFPKACSFKVARRFHRVGSADLLDERRHFDAILLGFAVPGPPRCYPAVDDVAVHFHGYRSRLRQFETLQILGRRGLEADDLVVRLPLSRYLLHHLLHLELVHLGAEELRRGTLDDTLRRAVLVVWYLRSSCLLFHDALADREGGVDFALLRLHEPLDDSLCPVDGFRRLPRVLILRAGHLRFHEDRLRGCHGTRSPANSEDTLQSW